MLVSERIGQFFTESESGRDRLEYTEYGSGEAWVVLLPAELVPRRMMQPLAHALAAEGLHVVTLDPLGHGRSDRPADSHASTSTARRSRQTSTDASKVLYSSAKRTASPTARGPALPPRMSGG